MLPIYKYFQETLEIFHKKSSHISPHLHNSIEFVYVTRGTLELGIGQELYHMEQGDFGIIFPGLIRHYQVFDTKKCTAYYLIASTALSGSFLLTLQQYCPENPVIPADKLHPDIRYAIQSLYKNPANQQKDVIYQAFVQLILARSLPELNLVEKSTVGSNDIIYQTVSYIAEHFQEEITLTSMAHDLGYSPYALSRVFSGTFHRNFNQYLNEIRLEYACALLQYTDQSITDAYENAGFESQRTFNRVFREKFHMSPREYRKMYKDFNITEDSDES